MTEKHFHAFWVAPVGMVRHQKVTDSLDEILALVKQDRAGPDEYTNVHDLTVIYGEKLEFEPCTVVETYRIKES